MAVPGPDSRKKTEISGAHTPSEYKKRQLESWLKYIPSLKPGSHSWSATAKVASKEVDQIARGALSSIKPH